MTAIRHTRFDAETQAGEKCANPDCLHAASRHNELGYCRSKTTPTRDGECCCEFYDRVGYDGRSRRRGVNDVPVAPGAQPGLHDPGRA